MHKFLNKKFEEYTSLLWYSKLVDSSYHSNIELVLSSFLIFINIFLLTSIVNWLHSFGMRFHMFFYFFINFFRFFHNWSLWWSIWVKINFSLLLSLSWLSCSFILLNFWCYRFNKTNFTLLEIIYRIVILKELSSENPIFISGFLLSKSSEIPWTYKQETHFHIVFLFIHHIWFFRHMEFLLYWWVHSVEVKVKRW